MADELIHSFPAGRAVLPSHPTLPVPWRVVDQAQDGRMREVSLRQTREEAEQEAQARQAETDAKVRQIAAYERPASVSEEVFRPWIADMIARQNSKFFATPDAPDLPVFGSYALAARATALGLKAREIWFQRYREVIAAALPPAQSSLVFLLEEGVPQNPQRTFVAQLKEGAPISRPVCPDCERPLDVAVHLNFSRHALPFSLPGLSLFLFTCSEHAYLVEAWSGGWMNAELARTHAGEILQQASQCLSGPPVSVIEYDREQVDESSFDTGVPSWGRFNDSTREAREIYALQATKIGGVAAWIQGQKVPRNLAGKPMEFIAQVAETPFMRMGDAGVMYLFYCPETQVMSKVIQSG